ncbi:MAG TPA: NAD(P)-dependent oxidoreductase [Patescibacteria group bacterium]|nr:NAD(P)-dependent oxidoreductase [Gammaproteobacteria bacterium]HWA51491.1 NAD(P)-dependent oxidoreductase [Patescibacteria group bacterium]
MICLIALYHRYHFWRVPQKYKEILSAQFPSINFIFVSNNQELDQKLYLADVLFCWEINENQLDKASKLSWIQLASSGLDKRIPPNFFSQYQHELTVMKGVAASAVAEFVLGIILGVNRRIFEAIIDSTAGIWNRESYVDNDSNIKSLNETCVGILGYGAIGSKLSCLLNSLGVRVIVCSKSKPVNDDYFSAYFSASEIDTFLVDLDFLVLTLPLNADSSDLLNENKFKLISKNTFIINIARESIINRESLINAINEKKIKGVLIDVLDIEPPVPESRYPVSPKIFITPHIAALSNNYWKDSMEIFMANLNAHLNKEPKINRVYHF